MVFNISEIGPECPRALSALNMRMFFFRFFFQPFMMDIDPTPGETQAALQTMSRVKGNTILLTRLSFFIAFLLFSSHFGLSLQAR